MKWFIKCLRQYFDFKGRARRKEYWMFYLWTLIIEAVIFLLSFILGGGLPGLGASEDLPPELMPRNIGMGMFFSGLITLYGLALLIPRLAVSVRRLHDTGKSGWWLLGFYFAMFCIAIVGFFLAIEMAPVGMALSFTSVWVTVGLSLMLVGYWLYLMVKKGDVGSNKYGEDPKEGGFLKSI